MKHFIHQTLVFLVALGAGGHAQEQSTAKPQIETEQESETQRKESIRKMFDFTADSADQWVIVNDGVMGGRSSSNATMTDGNKMKFSGTLSLANNGGFASVRSKTEALDLKAGDSIKLRVKGDGRKYTFNLYIPTQRVAFSYQKDFETKPNDWTEVTLPLSEFQAHSFGRKVDRPLDPTKVESVGILLGDKKQGLFEILIEWIRVASPQ